MAWPESDQHFADYFIIAPQAADSLTSALPEMMGHNCPRWQFVSCYERCTWPLPFLIDCYCPRWKNFWPDVFVSTSSTKAIPINNTTSGSVFIVHRSKWINYSIKIYMLFGREAIQDESEAVFGKLHLMGNEFQMYFFWHAAVRAGKVNEASHIRGYLRTRLVTFTL